MGCSISVETPERVVYRSSAAAGSTENIAPAIVDVTQKVVEAAGSSKSELGTFFSTSSAAKCTFCEHLTHPSVQNGFQNIGSQQFVNKVSRVNHNNRGHKSGWSVHRNRKTNNGNNRIVNNLKSSVKPPIWAITPKTSLKGGPKKTKNGNKVIPKVVTWGTAN